ncbi:unnamed protein product, partial [Didymodactylos carnosus]
MFTGVVDGVGGTAKRLVYEDVMVGKTCRNAADFVRLLEDKNTPIILSELLPSEIDDAENELKPTFDNVKLVS